ncbi:MAG: signal peptidase I [Candidatus Thorarchaeota archaeon]|nr:MAG: signal peptidase I [Candidatus Thorarchaeota archaeon]
MEKLRDTLGWNTRSDFEKTLIVIVAVVGITIGSFGVFTIAMGTSSPLVVVTSDSMHPTLEVGHLLVLQAHAPEDIHVGDIIVYNADWHPEAPIVHRVIQIEQVGGEYRYYTKGDNNVPRDRYYRTYEDIVGVVVFAIPYVGYITLFLHEPIGFFTVLAILIVFLFVPEILDRGKEGEDEDQSPSDDMGASND